MVVKRPTDYEPAPVGKQLAVCARIYDLGKQPGGYRGKIQHKCVLLWELWERRKDNTRFTLTKDYTANLGDKSYLRRDLESWRGKPFADVELEHFDLDKALNQPCILNLVAVPREGRNPFIDIASIEPAPEGVVAWKVEIPEGYVPAWVAERIANRSDKPSGAEGMKCL